MLRVLPAVIEPESWVLAFHKTSPYWWVRWLALGKFKHVSAFAWVPDLRLWVYFDVTLGGTHVMLLPDSAQANAWIADRTADADLMRMPRRPSRGVPLMPFFCVPAIKHLIGLRCGALRVSALYRQCLANGGEIHGEPAPTHDRPADPRAATAGAGG